MTIVTVSIRDGDGPRFVRSATTDHSRSATSPTYTDRIGHGQHGHTRINLKRVSVFSVSSVTSLTACIRDDRDGVDPRRRRASARALRDDHHSRSATSSTYTDRIGHGQHGHSRINLKRVSVFSVSSVTSLTACIRDDHDGVDPRRRRATVRALRDDGLSRSAASPPDRRERHVAPDPSGGQRCHGQHDDDRAQAQRISGRQSGDEEHRERPHHEAVRCPIR